MASAEHGAASRNLRGRRPCLAAARAGPARSALLAATAATCLFSIEGLDLVAGDLSIWKKRDKNSQCPVYMPLDVSVHSHGGVLFTPPEHEEGLDVFTLVQRELPDGALLLDGGTSASGGLKLTVMGLGDAPVAGGELPDPSELEASPWRVLLRESSESNKAFIAAFEVRPGGPHNVFVPWQAFRARILLGGGLWQIREKLNPSAMKVLAFSEPQHKSERDGAEVTQLAVHKAEVIGPIEGVRQPVDLDTAGNPQAEAQCLCDTSCARFSVEYTAKRSAGYCSWGSTAGRGVRPDDDGTFLDACLAVLSGPATRLARGLSLESCPSWNADSPGALAGKWLMAASKAERLMKSCQGPFGASRVLADMFVSVLSSGGLPEGPKQQPSDPMADGYLGPWVGKAISGHNNINVTLNTTAEECMAACNASERCRSFDYGARGVVTGQCLLSTADRESAWGFFTEWPLYDYYERPLPVGPLGFHGPFVERGVSGRNDLQAFKSVSRDECIQKCSEEPRCRSVDFGARGAALGECWMSTADRRSDAARFTRWLLYDYYEAPMLSNKLNTLQMAEGMSDKHKKQLQAACPLCWNKKACCQDPQACAKATLSAGVPLFNRGDTLGCFWIFKHSAEALKDCTTLNEGSWDWVGTVFEALHAGAIASISSPEAAWILRGGFDVLFATASEKCTPEAINDPYSDDPLLELPELEEVESSVFEEDLDKNPTGISDDRTQFKSPPPQPEIIRVRARRPITKEASFPWLVVFIIIAVVLLIALGVTVWMFVRMRRRARAAELAARATNISIVVGNPVEHDANAVEAFDGANLSVPKDAETGAAKGGGKVP